MEVYKENGILGFFSGLIPRVIGDIIFLLLASTATYAVNTYVFEEMELQLYTSATMSVCILFLFSLTESVNL